MKNILIIPDVHGRKFWHKAIELIDSVDKVVFLGDYLDPYLDEGISRLDAIKEFKEIIKFKIDHPDKVVLLLGNHDCSYCFNFGSATRYDYSHAHEIKELFNQNINLFELFYKKDNYLFSHAGITNYWLKTYFDGKSINEFLTLNKEDIIPYLWTSSYLRGGNDFTGSIIWSDVREDNRESTFYQVFGHTQLESNPIITNQWACLDVRRCFLLDTNSKKIEEVKYEINTDA